MTFDTTQITGVIDNWSVNMLSPYMPPDNNQVIYGEVSGHVKKPEGSHIRTSVIEDVQGRYVKTHSGSVYLLGKPHPDFIKYCIDGGHYVPTADNPIRWVEA